MSNSVCGCTHVADDELTCWIGHAPRWGAALSLSSFSFSLQIRVSSHARLVMLHRDELRQQSSDNMQSSSAEASVSLTAASTAFVPIIAVLEKLAGMCTAQCQPPLPLPDLSLMFRFQGISEVTSFQNTPAAAFTWLLMIVTWAPLVVRTIFVSKSRKCGQTELAEAARKRFLKNRQTSKKNLPPAKAISKVFPAVGEFVENSLCRKTFDIIVRQLFRQGRLQRSCRENFWIIHPSKHWLTLVGKEKEKSEFIDTHFPAYHRRSHNALKMFLVSAPQEI